MKRYYRKRNGIVFFISIVIIFLYLTTVDWDRRQWGLSGILNIITDYYMPFVHLLILGVSLIVTHSYLVTVKGRREGELFYVLPVRRQDVWMNQWKGICGFVVLSWMMAGIMMIVAAGKNLSEVSKTDMGLSFLAYILLDVMLVSLLMWLHTKVKSNKKVLGVYFGGFGICILFLQNVTKFIFMYLKGNGVGLYSWLNNILYTFLYPKQASQHYFKMLGEERMEMLIFENANDYHLNIFQWQISHYAYIYIVMALILILLILFFVKSGKKDAEKMPEVMERKWPITVVAVWMLVFSILVECANLASEVYNLGEQSICIDSIGMKCFSYYNNPGGTIEAGKAMGLLLASVVIAGLIMIVSNKLAGVKGKRHKTGKERFR